MRCMLALATLGVALLASGRAPAAGDITSGRETARQCAVCHGIDGIAKQPDAPNLAGESALYLETQLRAYSEGRRQHEIMSIIAANLSDTEIANVAAWYSAIRVSVELPE